VSIHEVLKHEIVGVCLHHFLEGRRTHLLDGVQHVLAHVLISVLLKHFSGQLLPLVLHCMDEVAVVSSGAPCWPMVVLARHCSVVARSDLFVGLLLLQLCLLNLVGL